MLMKLGKGIASQAAISIGLICLALALLGQRFLPETNGLDFFVGMLTGLSLVMNIWGLLQYRAQRVRSGR
jgi:hypothetical protein